MTEYNKFNMGIIKKIYKTTTNPYGIVRIRRITIRKPIVFILGGNGTIEEKRANNYASRIRAALRENDLGDINVYSVFYNADLIDDAFFDRVNLFRKAGRKITLGEKDEIQLKDFNKNEPSQAMIRKLYEVLIAPRITDKFGGRINAKIAIKNIRKINIFAHCHGAVVASHLETMMTNEMKKLGYDKDEIAEIQHNILVIAHAPWTPLEKSAFTSVSFASANDGVLEHYNHFQNHINARAKNIKPSFFPDKLGNLFVVGRSKLNIKEEHVTSGLPRSENSILTDDGRILYSAERNALINGIKNSMDGQSLPSVAELVSGPGVDFNELKKNGEEFYAKMLTTVRNDERSLAKIAKIVKDISKNRR